MFDFCNNLGGLVSVGLVVVDDFFFGGVIVEICNCDGINDMI